MRKDRRRNDMTDADFAAGNGVSIGAFFSSAHCWPAPSAQRARPGRTASQSAGRAARSAALDEGARPQFTAYGQPSRFEAKVVRAFAAAANPATLGIGTARTPLQLLTGMITPNGLHFDRSHSGTPDIDPDQHRLLIHGLVKRPLVFTMEALARYPISRASPSSSAAAIRRAQPRRRSRSTRRRSTAWSRAQNGPACGWRRCWTKPGVDPSAKWVIAEGADAAAMSRSVPLAKCMDDALLCLYQNGERVRPSNGYPVRLLLPGFEGNMNVKSLRRLKLAEAPAMTKDETSKNTILLKDGKAWQFVFPME